MNFPEDLKYTKEHEWVKMDGNTATVGITAFAQSELGDIVYVDIETIGEEVEANEVFGSIEAVKTVADLFMPITGKVVEKNDGLEDNPEYVNESPYDKGWLIKVEVTGDGELMSADEYKAFINQ